MKKNEKSPSDESFNDKKIEALLSPKTKMDLKIEKALLGLQSNFNLAILVNRENYSSAILSIMRRFSGQPNRLIIYVAVNRPVEKIKSELERENIGLKNVEFVDKVTLLVGAQKTRGKNITYLPSTASLNDLMEAIESKIREKGSFAKLLVFDSVSTMLVYNDPVPVEKMIHSLIGKLNKFKVDGVFLMAKSHEHASVIQMINQFCDKAVEMEKL